ncbi:hypothetical protein DNTS_035479 [Danionella cerebrum]|uniref:Leucine-rich repeat and coiled-coil domain-containing protein 1 n=1 Tax=Danionella cerebrum TaxID=2873325 RepID=A0A553R657_9TELE|nr:hypothetical protein DNTS_035479 [Danionella translucida]TRY97669.1 hypothetical protein DNTS_035479 [Danionella translucida]
MAVGELCLIDKGISSLLEVSLNPSVSSLNLHCNVLTKIEGLTTAWHIRHLDLSSNHICRMEGLGSLSFLRLLYIHGGEYKLKYLQLHSNRLDCMNHMLQCMVGLQNLRDITLSKDSAGNPVCSLPGYREVVLQSLHQLTVLDGVDRLGKPCSSAKDSPLDVPCLEDFLEFLISSDTSVNGELVKPDAALMAPRITEVLTQFRQRGGKSAAEDQENEQRIKKLEQQVSHLIQRVPSSNELKPNFTLPVMRKAKRDTDQTSESDVVNTLKHRSTKSVVVPRRKTSNQSCGSAETMDSAKKETKGNQTILKMSTQSSEETYRAIVEERDQERERRWKAEQAAKRLGEQLKNLQTRASEEKDLQTDLYLFLFRLKELLLKERSDRAELQTRVQELEERNRSAVEQMEQVCKREEQLKRALRSMEESSSQAEALRVQQRGQEVKRTQELENRACAFKKEVEILRSSSRQLKEKLQQCLKEMTSKEEMHRKELATRLVPGGTEFKKAVSKEVLLIEQRFVKEAFDQVSAELLEVKSSLSLCQQKEKQSSSLVRELTGMVKEQKTRMTELLKAKREAASEFKSRVQSLESRLDDDKRLNVQVELLKKDKSKLISQLTAQESVIDGLRAERKIWGQELAQQGASLAQDRGRLEARIEVLVTELESQKKQNDRDSDALRIKAKIALLERDEQIRKVRDESVQEHRKLKQQLEEEMTSAVDLRDAVEQLGLRKEELKQQLLEKEAELDEIKETHRSSSKKWQEKAELLSRLESQVKHMKEGFDSKERTLKEERDKASHAHRAAVEKLHTVDDAFRRQLEGLQASHQAELLRLANDKQKLIEKANDKVFQVEEEMRQLLEETESNKRLMEEKMKRLTQVLKDF